MGERLDLTGKRYGKLTVLNEIEKRGHSRMWLCQCDCGKQKAIPTGTLTGGYVFSCGCNKRRPRAYRIDLTGKRFGRLVVIAPTEKRHKKNGVIWECKCDCGKTVFAASSKLSSMDVRSCGCLATEKNRENMSKARDVRNKSYVEGTDLKGLCQVPRSDNTSGVTGVCYSRTQKLWIAYIGFKGHRYNLGCGKNKSDMIHLRKEAEQRLHGEFLEWYYSMYPDCRPKDPPQPP
jgi:hypothetical protein